MTEKTVEEIFQTTMKKHNWDMKKPAILEAMRQAQKEVLKQTCSFGTDCKKKPIFHYCENHGWAEELQAKLDKQAKCWQEMAELIEMHYPFCGEGHCRTDKLDEFDHNFCVIARICLKNAEDNRKSAGVER